MSKACEICQRGYLRGMNRSHSNRGTIKRQYTNLQWTMREGKRMRVCTRCLKTLVHKGKAPAWTARQQATV